tara:strand:- start:1604 stop:2311 length:708 start_codon:yes stop_codon:yes gene_type:complete
MSLNLIGKNQKLPFTGTAAVTLLLAACGSPPEPDADESRITTAIPSHLAPFGQGYPNAGDDCRNLGESAYTSAYLDDSEILVGCPDDASAEELGGTVVDVVDGIRLVSVPAGNANIGMGENQPFGLNEDATIAERDYDAMASLPCGFQRNAPTQRCEAGVKREWREDGTTLVEVMKPDGRKRALYFNGLKPYGADSAESDGSAGWDFSSTREGDRTTITFGPETYVLIDAFIEGG